MKCCRAVFLFAILSCFVHAQHSAKLQCPARETISVGLLLPSLSLTLRGGGTPAAAGLQLADPQTIHSPPLSKRRKRAEFAKVEKGDQNRDYTQYKEQWAAANPEEVARQMAIIEELADSSEDEGEDLGGLSYDEWFARSTQREEERRKRKNWRHKETDFGQGVLEGRFTEDDIMGWCNYKPLDPNAESHALSALPQHQLNRHLLQAAQEGNEELLTRLVEAGADVNQGNNESFLPALVRFGLNDEQQRPMNESVHGTYGGFDAESKVLIAAVYNWTALHWAANAGRSSVVQLLLGMGAAIDCGDHNGMTPLHLAAANGDEGVLEVLLGAGANVSAADSTGSPPLFLAAGERHAGSVALLLRAGADVNATNQQGYSALHWAAQANAPQVAGLLLEHGADPDVQERERYRNPLTLAEELEHEAVCDVMAAAMGLEKLTPEEMNSVERKELEEKCRRQIEELKLKVQQAVQKDPFQTVSAEEAARRGPSMQHQILEEEELLERLQSIRRQHQEEGLPVPGSGDRW